MGLEVAPEPGEGTNLHHWRDCLDSYITTLRRKTKRNGWKYNNKSNREREANILEFVHLIGKPYLEHYSPTDMLRYKEHLYSLGRANDTVLNKLQNLPSTAISAHGSHYATNVATATTTFRW
jgi:hypothetical protein